MNRTKLKNYAPQARRDFIDAITNRAAYYGLTENQVEPITEQGDVAIIGGRAFPRTVAPKRKRLEERIARHGFTQVMEAMAYTWFNRLVAIRFMELHGYLDHGYRVLSHPEDKDVPEIVEHAEHVELPGLNTDTIIDLKLEGTKEAELYRLLLIAQCNALHDALPFLFERIDDETELLLPDNLLHSNSLIRKLVNEIDAEDWQEVEIIGWLYQFYISEKKDQVIGKVVKSEDIPAATQLFTPNWIVKYMVQNTLGRQWLATYPDVPLREKMEYYIEPAEQAPEVQAQLKAITPDSLNPEELTLLDPACGSGHILVEAYELLKEIYLERGYRVRDIPTLILQKNLFGLEIDDRAVQLAAFALMMKARADDRRIFGREVQPQVLSIQESKGLDVKKITASLNAPLEYGEKKGQSGDILQSDVASLNGLFNYGKTFGSLIRVPENLKEKLPAIARRVQEVLVQGGLFEQDAARSLKPLLEQARILADKYEILVANPPYMGSKYMNGVLKEGANSEYPNSKADLFALFIDRGFEFVRPAGHAALVTMQSWMFLSSYLRLRIQILSEKTILCMAHLGPRAFSSISGEVVTVTAFSVLNTSIAGFKPSFFRLIDGHEEDKRKSLLARSNLYSSDCQDDFEMIPGSPIAYWANNKIRSLFQDHSSLKDIAMPRQGMATTNNNLFLRLWFEIDVEKMGFGMRSEDEAEESGRKWFPYNKGGDYRKWYGNNEYVVNFENRGQTICNYIDNTPGVRVGSSGRVINRDRYFQPSVTWGDITTSQFAARLCPAGFIFDVKGSSGFPSSELRLSVLGLLCSNLIQMFMKMLNPTTTFQVGDLARVPAVLESIGNSEIVAEAVKIAKNDWDAMETSWDYQRFSLITNDPPMTNLCGLWEAWSRKYRGTIGRMKELEEENNALFIEAYSLQDELSPEVPEDQITLARPDREEDTKRLLSYALGCMMGRYSLDKPGLIYAHSENNGFDPSQYTTFPADQDGIVPLMETEWFPDDATNRFVEFISIAWLKEHLEENLTFVAESLGPNRNEQPLDTIRRYFASGFFKDHLKTYKRRPIYWLFSSGKQRAFQCLVYLHRYNDGTLSRMRTEYVIPLQGKIAARIDQLKADVEKATSTSHRRTLEKERDTFLKQQTELHAFDEKLRHYADQRISLDLDDGVKVNYGKFGDLLAEVKAVCGKV